MTAVTAISLMALLLTKHCAADFVLQTYEEVQAKGDWRKLRGYTHSLKHGVLTLSVLSAFANFKLALVLAFADFAVHYVVDNVKDRVNKRFNLTSQDAAFWSLLGLDQYLHHLTYIAITLCVIYS